MANWDVFHSERLEVERNLSTERVREGLAGGEIRQDDLIRPAGSSVPWSRMNEVAELSAPPAGDEGGAGAGVGIGGTSRDPAEGAHDSIPTFLPDDDEVGDLDLELDFDRNDRVHLPAHVEDRLIPGYDDPDDEFDPQAEDEEAAEFSLTRSGPEKIEELDLAAMVDVAFQLVLFFMVTATTIMYKTLEVPTPKIDQKPEGVTQGGAPPPSVDDLLQSFILVEVDPNGNIKVDRDPIAGPAELIPRLRSARAESGRRSMLLQADFATQHGNAVMAYDAANEIGLGIAIAKPVGGGEGSSTSTLAPTAGKAG